MSELIKHECGLAMVRLKKPLSYFLEKYGTPLWGFYKLFLLMEKQHNRGQDGAGIGSLKLRTPPGKPYMFRQRSIKSNPLDRIFRKAMKEYQDMVATGTIHPEFPATVKENFEFGAEILLGHLRYGTSGGYSEKSCHPYFRKNNWPTKNLMLAGNFNMTNTPDLNTRLIGMGQHPVFDTDTQTILEEIGFHLDEEHDQHYRMLRDEEGLKGVENAQTISQQLNPIEVIRRAAKGWDGGYAIAGIIGNGDIFAFRDPGGIRPLHMIEDDEVVAFASERAPLMTVFSKEIDEVREVPPGTVIAIKADGTRREEMVMDQAPRTSCTFERIYFSRGNDPEIYQERKRLGSALVPQILENVDYDLKHTVFSYIPNTAEIAYYGMMQGLREFRRIQVRDEILQAQAQGELDAQKIDSLIMANWPRSEKIAHKDIKLRTFITQEKSRANLVSHVYDVSYGTTGPGDSLVCLDDSVVRGTTLKQSIISILARLKPRKIIIASTAPQIRYPDCYGIDMSELEKFIAFQAAISLLKEQDRDAIIHQTYQRCLEQLNKPPELMENAVKPLYDALGDAEISKKIADMVHPHIPDWDGEVVMIFQKVEDLNRALPEHQGDWYFTGNYPTPGGIRVLNQSFVNYYEKKSGRSY